MVRTANAQKEFKHFGMNREFLLRREAEWRTEMEGILLKNGDIVEIGREGGEEGLIQEV